MTHSKNIEVAKRLGYSVYHYDKDVEENCYYALMDPTFHNTIVGWSEGERDTEAEAWNDLDKDWMLNHRDALALWLGRDGFEICVDGNRFGAVYHPVFDVSIPDKDGRRRGNTAWVSLDELPACITELWLDVIDIEAEKRQAIIIDKRAEIARLQKEIADLESVK